MLLLVVGTTVLLNSPKVQQRVSVVLATELENRIGTRVNLGGVRWLFPTDIVIDSLTIDDQEGEQLLSVNHIAAKVEWMPLLFERQLSIRNIRLFYPNIHIYKPNAESDYNYQFLVDAFASKKEKEKKKAPRLSLHVNTLLIRHAHVCHRINATPESDKFQFDNLAIDDFSTQLSLKTLSADSASLIVRHLKFKERSGLCVDNLYFRLVANRQGATLANFQLNMPHSALKLDTIWAAYKLEDIKEKLLFKGKILPSHITPTDLSALLPLGAGITERLHFAADFSGSTSRFSLKNLDIHTSHRDLMLRASARLSLNNKQASASQGNIQSLACELHEATLTKDSWKILAEQAPEILSLIPQPIANIGSMTATGNLAHDASQSSADLQVATDAGHIKTRLQIDGQKRYTVKLDGEDLDIAQVVPKSPVTRTDLALQAEGTFGENQAMKAKGLKALTGTLDAMATNTRILGYEYDSIGLNCSYAPDKYQAKLSLNDLNGTLSLNATHDAEGRIPHYTIEMQADSLNLNEMRLINLHQGNTFSTKMKAELAGKDFDHIVGKIVASNTTMHRPTDDFVIEEIALYASDPEAKMLSLQTDFMNATVRGEFTYHSLANSLLGHLHHSLPSLCQSGNHHHNATDNICLANISIHDATPLRELLLLPIDIKGKAQVDLLINDLADELKFTAAAPHIDYEDNAIKAVTIDCHSQKQGLDLYAGVTLQNEEGKAITTNIITQAAEDKIDLGAVWSSNPTGVFEGSLHTQASFALDASGKLNTSIKTDSAHTTLNHSVWKLSPFRLDIAPERILVDGLHFANDTTQHLSIDGIVAQHGTDTLQVSFSNLDLGYLLSLVKLEGISFGGNVSGQAGIAEIYTENPYIKADITASDLTFCDGPLGDVEGHIHWNQDASQLQFVADVWEDPRHTTVVDGHVDFVQDELWIDIAADSTNVSFLNYLLRSFMNDVKGHAYGNLTVGGPLKAINLDGALLADINFNLTPTDVDYHFRDTLRFIPDVIQFNGIEAHDQRGQKAIVIGEVTHNSLKDFACNLYVDAQNVLGIDLPDTGHNSFYTTIFGTGGVQIKSGPAMPLDIDIQAQAEKGSLFALNLASQNVSSSESFITFTDHSTTRNVPTIATQKQTRRRRKRSKTGQGSSTDINITAHITPDATLKLVMNQAVDDHISVSGNGDLKVSIHNDEVNLFGTYTVNRGFYRLSLQDVINKNFDVLSGSTVAFEGDPMSARLNITARHMVNYVPLKDLSPEMTGNAHVNCLLRIGGTLDAPTVAFDLDLPQGTEEEKAILRSYTTTEEQMGLQFIYLLGLGKFYTPDMAQNTQATSNMESFISTTISGQINNLLSNIISSDNWNFASNLRAENMMAGGAELDDGGLGSNNWENMEIEGILEGRLLDNRLLINGSFGYRENPMYASNFIGDFDIRYLLTGGLSLKGYNKTNDRYFSRTSLTTQGIGLVFQRDFDQSTSRRKRKKSKKMVEVLPTDTLTKSEENPTIR